jgi:DNA-binding response OmpR family regulator
MTGNTMTESIDVVLIEPSDVDARQTLAAIRQTKPTLSTLRVIDADQASRVMLERGLFTDAPQVPGLIIVDLAASGEAAKRALARVKAANLTHVVPIVIFSSRRTSRDILDAHLLGAHMNVQKPADPTQYAAAVQRMLRMWLTGSFCLFEAEAC